MSGSDWSVREVWLLALLLVALLSVLVWFSHRNERYVPLEYQRWTKCLWCSLTE